MTHFTREQLERTMRAYCFQGINVYWSSVELYGVPSVIAENTDLWNMTSSERKRLTDEIIEDLLTIGFLERNPKYIDQYQVTQHGYQYQLAWRGIVTH